MSPALGLKSSSTTDRSVTCGKSHYLPEPPLPHLFSGGKTPFPVTPQVFAAAAKSLQSCPTLCDPTEGSPPGFPIPEIFQARPLEWVAISFSNAWKWKAKVKSLSRVRLLATPWTAAHQGPPSMGFSRQEYWSGVPLPSKPFSWSSSPFIQWNLGEVPWHSWCLHF